MLFKPDYGVVAARRNCRARPMVVDILAQTNSPMDGHCTLQRLGGVGTMPMYSSVCAAQAPTPTATPRASTARPASTPVWVPLLRPTVGLARAVSGLRVVQVHAHKLVRPAPSLAARSAVLAPLARTALRRV